MTRLQTIPTSHGYCAYQLGTNVSPEKTFVLFIFSALPLPVDLLTNTPDYVTVRCGMLTWWTEHTMRAVASDSTRLNAHLDEFRSLRCKMCVRIAPQRSGFSKKK